MSPTQAALNTPTGRAAKKAGFGNATVTRNADGVVNVEFTKN